MKWSRLISAMGLCLAITAGQAVAQEIQQTSGRVGILKKWKYKPHSPKPQQEYPVHSPLYMAPHLPAQEPEQPEQPVEPLIPVEAAPMNVAVEDACPLPPLGVPPCERSWLPNIFGDAFASDRGLSKVANSVSAALPPTDANVLNPSEGVVGRSQIAEEASPIPTNRIYFLYDYFNHVPIVPGDIDVHRYMVGIEKTFLGGMASVDVRLPWATTLDSSINPEAGFHRQATELGNLLIVLKALVLRSDRWGVGGGMGIHVPTGNDTQVFSPAGVEVIRIVNESVILTPYVAAYWTNNRVFAQVWASVDFDTRGNPVLARDIGGPLVRIGSLNSQDLIQVDAQIGAWIYRNDRAGAIIQGVAPFCEFHYSTTAGSQDTAIAFGNTIGDFANHIDEINVSTGIITAIGEQSSLSVGAVLPLRDDFDRSFDYQIGVRANFRYGIAGISNPFGMSRY